MCVSSVHCDRLRENRPNGPMGPNPNGPMGPSPNGPMGPNPKYAHQELLALAVRQQMAADKMDRSKHIPRYVKYLADFAELCFLECDVSAARPDRHNEAVAE